MNSKQSIEDAAKDYAHMKFSDPDLVSYGVEAYNSFKTGALSDAAKEYWFEQFKDVAVKFAEWEHKDSWEMDYREQREHSMEEKFYYFINNIYGKPNI